MSKDLHSLTSEERRKREKQLLLELAKFGVNRSIFRQEYDALRAEIASRIASIKKTG